MSGDRKRGQALECRRCHRIGTRGFTPWGSEGWECSNDRACTARAEKREQPDPREIGLAIDAAIEMIESAEEDRALCDKLAGILTRTANVLKGEPKPLHRHSWHDLPEVAQRLITTMEK